MLRNWRLVLPLRRLQLLRGRHTSAPGLEEMGDMGLCRDLSVRSSLWRLRPAEGMLLYHTPPKAFPD